MVTKNCLSFLGESPSPLPEKGVTSKKKVGVRPFWARKSTFSPLLMSSMQMDNCSAHNTQMTPTPNCNGHLRIIKKKRRKDATLDGCTNGCRGKWEEEEEEVT